MRTPFGKECRYYFSDYYRGHSTEECRLIQASRSSEPWRPALCQTCPVPDILQANGSPNLVLRARVEKSLFGLMRQVQVTAYCHEHHIDVKNPKTGCPQCREKMARAAGI